MQRKHDRQKRNSRTLCTTLLAAAVLLTLVSQSAWAAGKEKLLLRFDVGDGSLPVASMIADAAGNLYGTTYNGGVVSGCKNQGCGVVFQLTPLKNGKWAEKTLHRFQPNGSDGIEPQGSLISDPAGNLYGTTTGGGRYGVGVVFQMRRLRNGGWTEKVLYSFGAAQNGADGYYPIGGLILDAEGNLYGATIFGGLHIDTGYGVVFELMPSAKGDWTEKVLHTFDPFEGTDGAFPYGPLLFDVAGNLYGTTQQGGVTSNYCQYPLVDCGSVFELKPDAHGNWTESLLYSFCRLPNCADGFLPNGGLVFDAAGNLYGTTSGGNIFCYDGAPECGNAFQLSPGTSPTWTEKILYNFCSLADCKDGAYPLASLIMDSSGNLYGTTRLGGSAYAGIVFRLTADVKGNWNEKILHTFNSKGRGGSYPAGGLVLDSAGNLYGTTALGGDYIGPCSSSGCGTVFEITP